MLSCLERKAEILIKASQICEGDPLILLPGGEVGLWDDAVKPKGLLFFQQARSRVRSNSTTPSLVCKDKS